MSVRIEPIKPLVGARVHLDKSQLTDPDVVETLRATLEERGVLIFPGINVTDDEQLAFTDAMGERVNFTSAGDHTAGLTEKDVYSITLDKQINKEPDYVLGTFFWHIDGLLLDIPIPKATVLSCRRLSSEGGATEFANLYAAYDYLPADEKQQLEGLRAIHTIEAAVRPVFGLTPPERVERYRTMSSPMEHPVVWTHDDGRKSLILGTHADGLVGWKGPHGRALLTRLNQWAAQPDFVYTHHWSVGDMAIWDNEGLMHRVVPYTDENRMMHRTSIGGKERPGHPATEASLEKMLEPVY